MDYWGAIVPAKPRPDAAFGSATEVVTGHPCIRIEALPAGADLVDMARWMHHNADGRPYSLRKVAIDLVVYGYTTPSGKPYSAAAVASMVQP
jgi:hypothetical protein